MSITAILFVVAIAFSLVATVLHVALVIKGFKVSVGWGLVSLLVPFGSLIFAFTKLESPQKMIWATALLLASFIAGICWTVASYQTAQAAIGAAEAATKGMSEAAKEINDLEGLDDLQL